MASKADSSMSRRPIVGGGATLAAASLASSTAKGNETMASQELTNPTEKYPRPASKKQSQPWPGPAGKMDPPLDHGEKTYRGFGRLAGRKALITGGDSGMGRGAQRSGDPGRYQGREILPGTGRACGRRPRRYAPFWITKAALPRAAPASPEQNGPGSTMSSPAR